MGVTQEWIAASHRGASNRNHPSFQLLACPAQRSEPCLQCNSLSRGVLHVWGNCCLVMWAAAAAVKCDDSRSILAAAPCSSLDSSRLFRDHHPGPSAYGGTPGGQTESRGMRRSLQITAVPYILTVVRFNYLYSLLPRDWFHFFPPNLFRVIQRSPVSCLYHLLHKTCGASDTHLADSNHNHWLARF